MDLTSNVHQILNAHIDKIQNALWIDSIFSTGTLQYSCGSVLPGISPAPAPVLATPAAEDKRGLLATHPPGCGLNRPGTIKGMR